MKQKHPSRAVQMRLLILHDGDIFSDAITSKESRIICLSFFPVNQQLSINNDSMIIHKVFSYFLNVLNWKTKAVYNLIYWNRTEKRFSYHDESKLKLQFIPLLLFIPISIWILKYTQCKILFDFKTMESLRVLGWTVKSNGLDLGNSQEN